MVWIVCVVLMTLIGVTFWYRTRNDNYPVHPGWISVWALVGAIFVGPLVTTIFLVTTSDEPARTSYLVNLGDSTGTSGRFFLGTGRIESGGVYTYYTGNGVDGFHQHTWTGGATIKYDDNGPARMECFPNDWRTAPRWILAPFPKWDDDWPTCNPDTEDVVFYVPSGTVKQDFVLDAQ